MDLSPFRGPRAFGPAYEFMMEHDAHAPGSVDRELMRAMVRLCPETESELYGSFTSMDVPYDPGTCPKLELVLRKLIPRAGTTEEALSEIAEFTGGLGARADQDLDKTRIGGTEEEIIERGSYWCTDVARVASVLYQITGIPCRIVYLFDPKKAYSGHAIVEAYRVGAWGAVDSSTAVVYLKSGGEPATVWDLMSNVKLVEAPPALARTTRRSASSELQGLRTTRAGRSAATTTTPYRA